MTFDVKDVIVNPAKILEETQITLKELVQAEYMPADVKREIELESGDALAQIDADFELAHENFEELLIDGKTTLKELLVVANSSGHPRAYEVAANFLKTLAELNNDLLDLNLRKQKAKKELGAPVEGPQKVNNNLFVGTPHDLLNALKEMNK